MSTSRLAVGETCLGGCLGFIYDKERERHEDVEWP